MALQKPIALSDPVDIIVTFAASAIGRLVALDLLKHFVEVIFRHAASNFHIGAVVRTRQA